MTDYPHLKNAPIVEAIIDIRASLPDNVEVADISRFAEQIKIDYPYKQERRSGYAEFKFDPNTAIELKTSSQKVDGFLLRSKDDMQIVQGRLDGFTFSRMKPYETWENVLDEAQKLWQIYCDTVHPVSVTRLAVRYVNRIKISLPAGELNQWFNVLPHIPDRLPNSLAGFFIKLRIPFVDQDVQANVILAIEPGEHKDQLPILFDIDSFTNQTLAEDDPKIWTIFSDLRDVKNQIFFETITDKTKELFS